MTTRARWAALALSLLPGCSLLFDPQGLPAPARADLSVVDDLSAADDLSPPEDLTPSPDLALPDLAPEDAALDLAPADLAPEPDLVPPIDLSPADCSPPLFPGFGDGGTEPPFSCVRCGCVLDDFTSAAHTREIWGHALASGLTDTVGGGLLDVNSTTADKSETDEFNSSGRFYLDGDFHALVDYKVVLWQSGAGLQLGAIGPRFDGGYGVLPLAIAYTFNNNNTDVQTQLFTNERYLQLTATSAQGTFEVSRQGDLICAGVVGLTLACDRNTLPARVYLRIDSTVRNDACSNNCSYHAQYSNFRLRTGVIVRTP